MEQAIVILLVSLAVGFLARKKLPRLKVLRGDTQSPCGSCEGCPYGSACGERTTEERSRPKPRVSKM